MCTMSYALLFDVAKMAASDHEEQLQSRYSIWKPSGDEMKMTCQFCSQSMLTGMACSGNISS